ncbi:hypothetical protein Igag_1649 [Ignisphaera aggregans DSM 17230]|uniref:Uncharacterized protein n=1 Tax=Ignisphaera aggregans (strain DSM 17230 / JCM 13409 / AQ1.S1) TaxID=583356 RepID=E0SRR6_IGNAA|nr:hypothetical protein Igag_1649 [Ignisphaera aggregans DSM 17230]
MGAEVAEEIRGVDKNRNDVEWPCNCFICRTLVHPLMRRFQHREEQEVVVEEAEEPVEGVESGAVAEQPQMAVQQMLDFKKIEESLVNTITSLVETKLRDFSSRINTVEEEVKNLREEFNRSLEDIRNALVDIRASISEATNPFNVLRSYTEISRERAPSLEDIEKAFEAIEKRVGGRSGEERAEKHGEEKEIGVEKAEKHVVEVSPSIRRIGLGGFIKLIKWVDDMLTKFPKEIVDGIIRFSSDIGIITTDERNIALDIVEFVYTARKMGVKATEQIVSLYTFAKIFGVEDKDADKELVDIATNR